MSIRKKSTDEIVLWGLGSRTLLALFQFSCGPASDGATSAPGRRPADGEPRPADASRVVDAGAVDGAIGRRDTGRPDARSEDIAGAAPSADADPDGGGPSPGDALMASDVEHSVPDARRVPDAGVNPDAAPWPEPDDWGPLPVACRPVDPLEPLEAAAFEPWMTLQGCIESTGDLDADGLLELYVMDAEPPGGSPYIDAWEWDGAALALRATWPSLQPFGTGDVDGDGHPELVSRPVRGGDPIVWGLAPSRLGSFELDVEAWRLPQRYPETVWAWPADIDGDPGIEVIAQHPHRFFEWSGGGLVELYDDSEARPQATRAWSDAYGPAIVGDFDADGRRDIVVPAHVPLRRADASYVRVLEHRGGARYQPIFGPTFAAMNNEFAGAGDVDGDGRQEFLRGGSANQATCWVIGLYTALADDLYGPVWMRNYQGGGPGNEGEASFGDTDGDGDDEVAVSMGDVVHVFENTGGWVMRRIFEARMCESCHHAKVRLHDVDGDGRAELIVSVNLWLAAGTFAPDGTVIYKRAP